MGEAFAGAWFAHVSVLLNTPVMVPYYDDRIFRSRRFMPCEDASFRFYHLKGPKKVKIDLFYGGPVSNNHYYLLKSEKDHFESIKIHKNLYWGNNLEYLFNQIEDGLIDKEDVVFFQGYSGWDNEQLDDEIENNSWIVLENGIENTFEYKESKSWNKIIKSLGKKYRIWSNSPDDISLN